MKRESLLQRSLAPQRYDEMFDRDGAVRPHWKTLADAIASDSGARAELAQRLSIDSNLIYNEHADPDGADRPWRLDPLPLVITTAEWQTIKTGVAQRARLLDAVLADLYGDQQLLRSGQLPTELAFAHPSFLWPSLRLQPPGGRWLHIYAADLARAPDGRWWLLADRTQAPSGLGYALQNRDIVTRLFPELIGEMGVRPLAEFFATFRESLLDGDHDALAVVLTPGPLNDSYAEHSYLARQLGLPLVEGSDLSVRDNSVYLKTMAGLRRVHAILRRVNDDYCDPLELRGESVLGVPGLMAALRAGQVRVANVPGTGVLESSAWQGFLPALAQPLLGEDLLLPSLATWWCGEAAVLPDVLANLDHLRIRPTFPDSSVAVLDGQQLGVRQLHAQRDRIVAQPTLHVVQERLRPSQMPTWSAQHDGRWEARALAIRVFAIATQTGYRVMPGALARVSDDNTTDTVSAHRGGSAKDVWVLSTGEIDATAPAVASPRLGSRSEAQPSRLVENLFWFGRYAERCEDKARLLRATLTLSLDPAARRAGHLAAAIAHARHFGVLRKERDSNLRRAACDPAIPFGLYNDVRNLARCGVEARSQISGEHWRTLSGLQQSFVDAARTPREPMDLLDATLLALTAMAGFTAEGMTRDEGWSLLMLGRRIERCVFLSDLLARMFDDERCATAIDLAWLLDLGDSTITHRTRYRETQRLATVFDLMLRDATNPRGLPFLVDAIRRGIARFDVDALDTPWPPTASTEIGRIDPTTLEPDDADGRAARHAVAVAVHGLLEATEQLADSLSLRYFVHADGLRTTVSA